MYCREKIILERIMARKKPATKRLLRSRTRTASKPIASGLNASKAQSSAKKRSAPRRGIQNAAAMSSVPRPIAETHARDNGFDRIVPRLSRKAAKAVSHLIYATERGGASARAAIVAVVPPLKQRVNEGYAATKKAAVGLGHEVGETASRLAGKTAKATTDATAKTKDSIVTAIPPLKRRVAKGYRATKKAAIGVGHEVRETTALVARKLARVVRNRTPGQRLAEAQKELAQSISKQVDDAVALQVEPAVAQRVALLEERIASRLKGQVADCVRRELEPLVTKRFAAAEGQLSRELDRRVKAASDRTAGALAQRLTASFDQKIDAAVANRKAAAESRAPGN
jgi:hypothetical protein